MNNFSAALAIVAQAKIRADEEEAKGMNALPDLDGDGIPGVPLPGAPMTPTFSTGQAVRDILSGTEGVVVDAPEGITDLIFVRSDIDGLTYAIRPDQLEVLPNAAPPMPMPMPGGPDAGSDAGAEEVVEEVKDEEVVAASLKAGKSYEEYKNSPEMKAIRKKRLAEEAEDKAAGRGPGVEPVDPTDTIITEEGVRHGAKAKLKSTSIVSDPGDLRKITYAKLKTIAGKTITSSKLVAAFGYVPQSWDGIVNALQADGVTVLRAGVKPDVRAMLAKKMNAREILLEACVSGGAIRASTIRRIEAVKNALAISAKLKANKRPKASLFRSRRVKAEIATKPTKPQPSADPGENMSWAWDNTKQEWYLQSFASKKIKAGPMTRELRKINNDLEDTRSAADTASEHAEDSQEYLRKGDEPEAQSSASHARDSAHEAKETAEKARKALWMKSSKKIKSKMSVMAGAIQKKVLDKMKKITEEAGFEFDVEGNWANTGTVYVRDEDFETLLTVSYDFQNSWGNFSMSVSQNGKHIGSHRVEYKDGGAIRKFLDYFKGKVEGPKRVKEDDARIEKQVEEEQAEAAKKGKVFNDETGEYELKSSRKIKATIKRLPSGKWRDTNGNSYANPEEAAEAEAHLYMDTQIDPEGEEYKTEHERVKEEILSNIGSSGVEGRKQLKGRKKLKAAGTSSPLPKYPEMEKLVMDGVAEAIDEAANGFEAEGTTEAVEHQSRDGFWAYTEGGAIGRFMTDLGYLSGTGYTIGDSATKEKIAGFIEQDYKSAAEYFREANVDALKDVPDDKVNYNDLQELGLDDLAEQLSEAENESLQEWSIMGTIGVNFFAPDNTRNQSGKPEFYVYATVNWEAPYHRGGKGNENIIFEEDIVAETAEELAGPLSAALAKAKAAF